MYWDCFVVNEKTPFFVFKLFLEEFPFNNSFTTVGYGFGR